MRILEVNDVASTGSMFKRGLTALGHEVALYQPTVGTYRRSPLFRAMIPAIRTVEALKMGRIYRRGKFDLLHIHYGTFGYMGIVARLPYFLHCHGSDLLYDIKRIIRSKIVKMSLKRAIKVFYSTPNLYSIIKSYREDAVFIPNPVDTDFFRPGGEMFSQKPAIRILSLSKMDVAKGWDVIIAAIRAIRSTHERLKIFAFGFGNDSRKVIKRQVRELKELGIEIMMPMNQYGIREMIRSSDIILGQFMTGAVSMSELEAISCGKPVICRFDFDSLYGEASPFLKAGTAGEVEGMVNYLIKNEAIRKRVGCEGRRWVEMHHSLESTSAILDKHLIMS